MNAHTFEAKGIPALSTPLSGEVDQWVKDIIKAGTGLDDPAREMPAEAYARAYRAVKEECKMVLQVPQATVEMFRGLTA